MAILSSALGSSDTGIPGAFVTIAHDRHNHYESPRTSIGTEAVMECTPPLSGPRAAHSHCHPAECIWTYDPPDLHASYVSWLLPL